MNYNQLFSVCIATHSGNSYIPCFNLYFILISQNAGHNHKDPEWEEDFGESDHPPKGSNIEVPGKQPG